MHPRPGRFAALIILAFLATLSLLAFLFPGCGGSQDEEVATDRLPERAGEGGMVEVLVFTQPG